MKKILLFGSLALSMGLASCEKGGESTSTESYGAYNLITNLDTNESFVSTATYTFAFNWSLSTGAVTSDNIVINNSNWTLSTTETPLYVAGNEVIMYPTGSVSGSSNLTLNSPEFIIAPTVPFGYGGVYYNDITVPGYTTPSPNRSYLVANYKLANEYRVCTFIPDAFFYGTTRSTYPSSGGTQSFSTDDISYRIVMNLKDMKASLIIYNAKFSDNPNEPTKTAIIAEGLDLEFVNGGYTITGEDIIPLTVEGNQTTPMDRYIFNKIAITNTSYNLATANISFTVAGIYTGEFSGSYYFQPKRP